MHHQHDFDPTYGYTRPQLLQVSPPEPEDDFQGFWRDTFAENAAQRLDLSCRKTDLGNPAVDVFEVEFNSLGGFRTGGWVTLPRNQPVTRGFVIGHGYGGRGQPDLELPTPDAAAIFPCARGFNRSARSHLPADGSRHVLVGIESRETYIHRGCAAEIWSAASALLEFVPQAAPRLDYLGGSFGGGIGALALPWDSRFQRAYLHVPSFGHHPLRITCPCVGSGEAVRTYHREHPEVLQVLAYYDSAVAARFLRLPVLFSCALFDPAVPPPGQFAVYNAHPGHKELFTLSAGHFEHQGLPEENLRLYQAVNEWFNEPEPPASPKAKPGPAVTS